MPREQVQWYTQESVHDSEKIHARQSCTYYSIVNVNKTNYPFSSSYEQEQTWTLTRTMSNNHKRYQSAIENIHLTMPNSSSNVIPSVLNVMKSFSNSLPTNKNSLDYENMKIKKDQSISLLPPVPPSQKHISPSLFRTNVDSIFHQEQQQQKILPIKVITNSNTNSKNYSTIRKPQPFTKPMQVVHANGEFVVRI